MICRITWTETLEESQQQHVVDFSFRDYNLTFSDDIPSFNCTLFYHFNHENETLFETAVLQHNCHIDSVQLIVCDEITQTYTRFNTVNNFIHSLNIMDGSPLIVLQLK